MKKLMIALCLTSATLVHAGWVPDPIDKEFYTLWSGTRDDQIIMTMAKIYICHKAEKIDEADFYMDLLEILIHDEPLPD